MLDLKELEQMLDEALAKETDESLTEWLMEQRKDEYLTYLGQGDLVELEKKDSFSFPVTSNNQQRVSYPVKDNVGGGINQFSLAA